jgi:hypothetical protein
MSKAPAYISMFPSPEEVFARDVEEHSRFLFPVFSIDISHINKNWKGKLHMLQFNEDPYNEATVPSFTDYCKDCMIAFDVIDGKYSFKTDFNYFSVTPDWEEWLEKTKQTLAETKKRFLETGELTTPHGSDGTIFEQIGGEPEWIQSDETPDDPDGNPMDFIARIYTGNYTDDYCAKDTYLFYSDKHKLAVLLYQNT